MTPKISTEHFIRTYHVPKGFCAALLACYHAATPNVINEPWRRCESVWVAAQSVRSVIKNLLQFYKNDLGRMGGAEVLNYCGRLEQPTIFRYSPDPDEPNHFHAHADAWNSDSATRAVSMIIYLTTVEQGGETIFPLYDLSVAPEAGKVLIFPSSFPFIHQAMPPVSNDKFILVSWIHWDGMTKYESFPL